MEEVRESHWQQLNFKSAIFFKVVFIRFIYYEKAFDIATHNELTDILKKKGINLFDLVQNIYCNPKMQ